MGLLSKSAGETAQSDLIRGVLLALAYFASAQVGLLLHLLEHSVTIFWPPSGIALAALLLFGVRLWPAVFLGAVLANSVSGLPMSCVLGISTGSTAGALLGVYLLKKYTRFDLTFSKAGDVFGVLCYGALLSALLSALVGSSSLLFSGVIAFDDFAQTAAFWWMGDALGVVLFAPLTLAIFSAPPLSWTPRLRQQAEIILGVLLILCVLIFSRFGEALLGLQPKVYLLIPLLVWAAISFDLRMVGVSMLMISLGVIYSVASGEGFFQNNTPLGMVDAWLFLMVLTLMGMTIAAASEQRNRARQRLERSEMNLKRAQHVSNLGSWQLSFSESKWECSEETYLIYGIAPGAELTASTFIDVVHPDDREKVNADWRKALSGSRYDMEHRIVVNGQIKWVRALAELDFDRIGRAVRAVGTVQDITRRKQDEEDFRLAAKFFESTNELILISDADNNIVTANPSFLKASGYTLDEIKGRNPRMFASGEHDRAFYQNFWKAINETGRWQGEIIDKNKFGQRSYKETIINAVRNPQGELTHYISIASDISERKEHDKNIHFLAYYDVLTGLPNRTLLRDRIGQMIAIAHRDNQRFALLFLDLDRFKYINDSMGHSVGDRLLQSVAQRLQSCVREGDTVSRIGGDEFIVLLREIEGADVESVADKLLKTLSTSFNLNGQIISTNGSIGIALYPDDATDIDVLMKNADAAMYAAKESGRNNYKFFTPEMNFRANQVFSMEKDIRVALEQDQFTLVYQPQVDLTRGTICGAEALIRWKHPEKGFVSPAEFIPIAEETGQIVAIGEWVMRTACWRFAQWQKNGMPAFPIAVNLSMRQLRQPGLGDLVVKILRESQLKPECLELEITEGIMMGDTQNALDFLNRMRELGVQMSIDDFGTGFSSLNYLKNLPVHKLKIDQSFVRDIETDESDAAIVRSIISLGHRLELRVIAEGVESQEQIDFMRIRGCDEVQGYFFSRPLVADEFFKFVMSHPRLG